MKQIFFLVLIAFSTTVFAKDYQVTGSVLEVSDTKIVIDKKGEKFEIAKSPATKVSGTELKKGQKATVYYSMSATEVEVKPEAKAKKK